jgi:hypothetical protein
VVSSFGPTNQNPVHTFPSPPPCVPHVPPPYPPEFNHPSSIRWRIQAVNFIIMQFSPRSAFLLLGPNILNTLFSKTLSQYSSLKVRDQVSHPCSTAGKIRVVYNLIFSVFWYDTGREKILDWIIVSISWIESTLDFIMMSFRFVSVVRKYLNFATFLIDSLAILMFRFCPKFWWRYIIIYFVFSVFISESTSLLASKGGGGFMFFFSAFML